MTANSFIILVVAFATRLTISEAFVLPSQACKTYSSLQESILQTDAATTSIMEEKKGNFDKLLVRVPELIPIESGLISSRRVFVSTAAIAASSIVLSNAPANAETMAAASASAKELPSAQKILQQSAKKAISGGKAGATASIFQVLSLMWLRTSMNYQYRYGGTLGSSLSSLYEEGGVGRLYQGLPFALIQGPLTRFGDTAANVGILALLDSIPELEALPLPLKTACGSICAGLWRIVLMPVDTSKTVMQVEGKEGLEELYQSVKDIGPAPLYRGAVASAAATAVGHFPWFLTYNFLNDVLPVVQTTAADGSGVVEGLLLMKLGRSALLGCASSCVSDVCSNSLRVIKTTKQTAGVNEEGEEMTYKGAVAMILEQDGWAGLFGRGLQTRLLTNAIQGAVFSVLWRYFQEVPS
mmetsp:Transcript_28527/g.42316  ORF Transcript_28527/g.42316 Transcript_28527/m.42316 type:complete len:412 (-) Transcript_28527:53-1288(-)